MKISEFNALLVRSYASSLVIHNIHREAVNLVEPDPQIRETILSLKKLRIYDANSWVTDDFENAECEDSLNKVLKRERLESIVEAMTV